MTTGERSAAYGTDDNLQPRPRRKLMLVVEKPDGSFMYHTRYGWTDVTSGQTHHALKVMTRLPLSALTGKRRVAKQVASGLEAFGKPFVVDLNEEKS